MKHSCFIRLSTINFPTQKYKILYHVTHIFVFHITVTSVSSFSVTLLSVNWYNETRTMTERTKDVRTGNKTLNIFVRFLHNQTKFSKIKTGNIYYKHITVVTWSGILYHVLWMSSHHQITLDALRLVGSFDMSSSTGHDTVCQSSSTGHDTVCQSSSTGHDTVCQSSSTGHDTVCQSSSTGHDTVCQIKLLLQ